MDLVFLRFHPIFYTEIEKESPFLFSGIHFFCFLREGHIHRSAILMCLSKGVTVDFCCKNISTMPQMAQYDSRNTRTTSYELRQKNRKKERKGEIK